MLDTQPDVHGQAQCHASMPAIQGEVEFDHVSAAYVPGDPVLNDVSFIAEPGQTVAIVGPTGAGKTTIINLIPRFYDVVSGQITIDEHGHRRRDPRKPAQADRHRPAGYLPVQRYGDEQHPLWHARTPATRR